VILGVFLVKKVRNSGKSKLHNEKDFTPHPELLKMTKPGWEMLTEEKFQKLFTKSAVNRTKYVGLKRNIHFLSDESSRSI